uniref:Uncharacterized protein n=1 Tax=Setaria italica TaxID=4555 RepID=K3ZNF5_SETIT
TNVRLAEETFARLRYLLGGLRPVETVYLRLSLGSRASAPIHGLTTLRRPVMAWATYFSAVAPGMSLVEKQWLVHRAHTSALQRLVLGPRLKAFSQPLLTLKK